MIFIGENIHVISKNVREALLKRDESFVKKLLSIQSGMDFADLNVGPARGDLSGILSWICPIVEENSNLKLCLDTTNFDEMRNAFEFIKSPEKVILNSTTGDDSKLKQMLDLVCQKGCNLIALTMTKEEGIPKSCDGRMEIAFKIYEKCLEKNIAEKVYFDPLILPVKADQSQAKESLDTLKMLKEAFEIPVKTVIGLSNISNGAPENLRWMINRVYAVLAFGAGLDAVIMDASDNELKRILNMLEEQKPQNDSDNLYLNLSEMMKNFGDLEDIKYDKKDSKQVEVIKTCEVFLNKKIYSDSFAQV